jgi:hypothetical protein
MHRLAKTPCVFSLSTSEAALSILGLEPSGPSQIFGLVLDNAADLNDLEPLQLQT